MTKRSLLIAVLACSTLAACGSVNRGLESVHQPVVRRADYAFDVQTDGAGLAQGEAKRLDGWLRTMKLGYGDTIAIDDPNGDGARTRDDVAQVAAAYGLMVADQAPVTGAPVAPGTARVVVSRTTASVESCPRNTPTYMANFDGRTMSEYGCATNSNLAMMIANPADLVRGAAATGGYDAVAGTRAITELRAAKPTGDGGTWVKSKAEQGGKK